MLVSNGLSNKAIANHLGVKEGTVKVMLHNVFTKLDVPNRTVLAIVVAYAYKRERGREAEKRAIVIQA